MNYPDSTGEFDPRAPWNWPDGDRDLVCDTCDEYAPDGSGAEEGDPCDNTDPMTDKDGKPIPPCTGSYRYQGTD